jgi:hypothetical protein
MSNANDYLARCSSAFKEAEKLAGDSPIVTLTSAPLNLGGDVDRHVQCVRHALIGPEAAAAGHGLTDDDFHTALTFSDAGFLYGLATGLALARRMAR